MVRERGEMSEIDYAHDSLAEICLAQREIIERQGVRLVDLVLENQALKDDADSVIAAEYERLTEALLLVEHWIFSGVQEGRDSMSAQPMHHVLSECLEYAETGKEPPWFEAAVREAGR